MVGRRTYGRRPRGNGKIMRLVDFIVICLTLFFAVLLALAYLARYVDPNDFWPFAFFGLGAPFLYLANILLVLYWVVRWKVYFMIPLAVLLIGYGSVKLFFKPSLTQNHDREPVRSSYVMSFNVEGFVTRERGTYQSTVDSITAMISRINPEIICFQEFQAVNAHHKLTIDSLVGLQHNVVNYKLPNSAGGGWGLAIYSRYPIVTNGVIDFERSTNSVLWADMVVRGDTLRVVNAHLQTTEVDSSDREYINNHEYLSDGPGREERVRSIAGKLRNNFRLRAAQADSVASLLALSSYPVIVCGDLNDTPMSYVYHRVRGDLNDAFVEKGSGMPNTYKGLFNIFRIDYVFHSPEIPALSYRTPQEEFSDHKPLVVGFDFSVMAR